jgi:hypothetical protein
LLFITVNIHQYPVISSVVGIQLTDPESACVIVDVNNDDQVERSVFVGTESFSSFAFQWKNRLRSGEMISAVLVGARKSGL